MTDTKGLWFMVLAGKRGPRVYLCARVTGRYDKREKRWSIAAHGLQPALRAALQYVGVHPLRYMDTERALLERHAELTRDP